MPNPAVDPVSFGHWTLRDKAAQRRSPLRLDFSSQTTFTRESSMFKKILFALLVSGVLLTGCSTIKISERNTSIVMAKDAKKGEGPTGISDKFGLEGKIVAYMTFRWDETNVRAGQQNVEVKWFSGDKLVSTPKNTYAFGKSPHYVWFTTYGTALGVGKARVDVYVDGVFVGRKSFEVVEKL